MKFLFKNTEIDEDLIYLEDDKIQCELCDKLNTTKTLIDKYPKEWEYAKKNIHEHEYIYTSNYKINISKISPISRSYFKFTEIYHDYNILDKNKNNKIVCLAEAPGGFIQSILHLLPYDKILKVYGNSLQSEIKSIPKWNTKLLHYDKISFYNGMNDDGNLYDFKNVISLIQKYGRESVDLVTGDGGFDYSSDYSKQEINSYKLIYSEIFIALNIQRVGGNFVCKLFDIFHKETIILISILIRSYHNVYIHKPCVSRNSNSEKYIICKNFKGYNNDISKMLCHGFGQKLDIPISKHVIEEIMNINKLYCNNQIKKIKQGVELIKNKYFKNDPTENQIKSAYNWCIKYNIQINYHSKYIKMRNPQPVY
jgi:23S rRNA U2552 (ribose-2'-O)-methylase RlmE/FtsJ